MNWIASFLELFPGIVVGLLLLYLIAHLFFSSFYGYLLLLCAIHSGKYVVHMRVKDGETTIKLKHVKEPQPQEEHLGESDREISKY